MRARVSPLTSQRGSLLVIVLWISLGLVTVTLYFANSMSLEMKAAENRVAALAADQAIDGACRYVKSVLTDLATNGTVPSVTSYYSEAVPIGDSRFWLIGRPVNYNVQPDQVFFGLVDESSKINLNTANLQTLSLLTNMTLELAANIFDWRNTNGVVSENGDGPTIYAQLNPAYMCKNSAFETVDELKLVYPMELGLLYGEDWNLNGALDPGEMDTNRNNVVDSGILEYVTVYTKEPNTGPDGSQRIDISNLTSSGTQLRAMLETNLTTARLTEVLTRLGLNQTSGAQQGGGGAARGGAASGGAAPGGPSPGGATGPTAAPGGGQTTAARTFASPLAFYRGSGLTSEEFAAIAPYISATNSQYISGRVNVNTASAPVLACLPGLGIDLARQLVTYRQQSPDQLTSLAWVAEALGQNNETALQSLEASDCITTQSYQFTADIAALGPHGRGYRRVKFVFDLSSGSPEVVYRQDLTHLGWALGTYVRQTWTFAKDLR